MAQQYTEQDVTDAEEALVAAKSAVGNAKQGAKVEAYREAADNLTRVRVAFRQQEEQAGTRAGFISGDAAS